MPRLQAVVFDLWGTLMAEDRAQFPERARLRFEGCAPILARYGVETTLEEFTRRQAASNRALARLHDQGRDLSAEERARHVLYQYAPAAADRMTPEDVQAFIEGYGGTVLTVRPHLLPGARQAILEARAQGMRVGLISNTGVTGGRHLRRVLDHEGLLDAFDSLIFSDEVRRAKPHPQVFTASLAALGASPETAVFVGDTPRFDVGPPRRFGWWVVQVGERDDGDPPAHRRVPGVAHLFDALRDLGLVASPGE